MMLLIDFTSPPDEKAGCAAVIDVCRKAWLGEGRSR